MHTHTQTEGQCRPLYVDTANAARMIGGYCRKTILKKLRQWGVAYQPATRRGQKLLWRRADIERRLAEAERRPRKEAR